MIVLFMVVFLVVRIEAFLEGIRSIFIIVSFFVGGSVVCSVERGVGFRVIFGIVNRCLC